MDHKNFPAYSFQKFFVSVSPTIDFCVGIPNYRFLRWYPHVLYYSEIYNYLQGKEISVIEESTQLKTSKNRF